MHCPYCGSLDVEVGLAYRWAFRQLGPFIITCEENGERHHVELMARGWGTGVKPLSAEPRAAVAARTSKAPFCNLQVE